MTERFAPNPDYGKGTFWRRIRISNAPGQTIAELEDNSHAMRCRLRHDNGIVIGTDAEMLRVPMNNCSDAGRMLNKLVGMPTDTPYRAFFGGGNAALNCTHLYDIAWLALAYAGKPVDVTQYDVTIPDKINGSATAVCARDGGIIHEWPIQEDHIVAPPAFAAVSLTRGFIRWALENLEGDELEAALVLHKGYFVAQARKYRIDAASPAPSTDLRRRNACFAFAEERVESTKRIGSRIDLTGPEALLLFPPPRWR